MKKQLKSLALLLCFALVLTLMACSGDDSSSSEAKDGNEVAVVNEQEDKDDSSKTDDEKEDVTEADEKEDMAETEEEVSSGLSNSDLFKDVTYTIVGSRILTEEEFKLENDDDKAVLISMVIENDSTEIIRVSALMMELEDENGGSYSCELGNSVGLGNLNSIAAPGKIIRGDMLVVVDETATNLSLSYYPDMMDDKYMELALTIEEVYGEVDRQSSSDGKGLGEEMQDDTLNYTVNSVEVEGDILKVNMTAINSSEAAVDDQLLPFVLTDNDGYALSMNYNTLRDVFYNVPAKGSKDGVILFDIENHEASGYDFYISNFMGVQDYMHFEMD